VVSSKLKLDELAHERARAAAELHGIDAQVRGNEDSLKQLRSLQEKLQSEVTWYGDMTTHKTNAGVADLRALEEQAKLAQSMLAEQDQLLQKAEVDLSAGLITRSDYARELQRQRELQRNLLDTQRAMQQGRSNMQEISLNARGIRPQDNGLSPQQLANQEQLTQVKLEIIKLESDMQRQLALSKAALDRFGEIDRLVQELMERPVFKAINQKLDLAFVPYSQLDGVTPNAVVYACRWGILFCEQVGRVSTILDGEVNQTDPWGIPARGQYAVLELTDRRASRAKTLRVRAKPVHGVSLSVRPVSRALAADK
jgi:hypothetical protein